MLGETIDQRKRLRHAESLCQAEMQKDGAMWQFRVMLAQMLRERSENSSCLEALRPILADNDELLATTEFSEVYWTVVMPLAGACYAELKDMDAALECYQKTLDHARNNTKPPTDMTEVVSWSLNAILYLGKLSQALKLLRTLRNLELDGQSWLNVVLGRRDSIHHHILSLCRRSDDFDIFTGFYDKLLETVKMLEDSQAARVLRLHRWKLQWHCGPPECRDQALDEWQAMLEATYEQEVYSPTWYVDSDTAKEMAHALFSKALKSGLGSGETQEYINGLDALKLSFEMLLDFSLFRSTKLTVARLYHLSGNTGRAKAILRADVRSAIRCITTEDDEQWGYQVLGLLLPIIEDDVNARAAWSILEPSGQDLKKPASMSNGTDEPSGTPRTASSPVPLKSVEDRATAFEDTLKEIGMAPQIMESSEPSLDTCESIKQLGLQAENGNAASHESSDDQSNKGNGRDGDGHD